MEDILFVESHQMARWLVAGVLLGWCCVLRCVLRAAATATAAAAPPLRSALVGEEAAVPLAASRHNLVVVSQPSFRHDHAKRDQTENF